MSVKTKNEAPIMTRFIARVNFPREMFLYLFTTIVMISTPPVLPPAIKMMPLAKPPMPPPMIAASNLSEITGKSPITPCKNEKKNDMVKIQYMVLIPNRHPRILNAKTIRIRLRAKIVIPVESPVTQYTIVAIPLTPPPNILFGMRKAVDPRAIINMQTVITK